MEIRIPTKLSEFKLYKLAEEVVTRYNIDKSNLYKYPIDIFNRLVTSMDIPIDEEYLRKLAEVFQYKGSLYSVEKLLNLLGIKCEGGVTYNNNLYLTLNINIPEVNNLSFVNYLTDALNYLILYSSISILIYNYVNSINFIYSGRYVSSVKNALFNVNKVSTKINNLEINLGMYQNNLPKVSSKSKLAFHINQIDYNPINNIELPLINSDSDELSEV